MGLTYQYKNQADKQSGQEKIGKRSRKNPNGVWCLDDTASRITGCNGTYRSHGFWVAGQIAPGNDYDYKIKVG